MDFTGSCRLLHDFAYEIAFSAFVEGGGRGYLANLPRKIPKTNLNWVHGFHRVLEAFRDFAYEIVFLHFWKGEAQGTFQISPGKSPNKSNLN